MSWLDMALAQLAKYAVIFQELTPDVRWGPQRTVRDSPIGNRIVKRRGLRGQI